MQYKFSSIPSLQCLLQIWYPFSVGCLKQKYIYWQICVSLILRNVFCKNQECRSYWTRRHFISLPTTWSVILLAQTFPKIPKSCSRAPQEPQKGTIISFQPISNWLAPKSIHQLGIQEVRIEIIGTIWWAISREMYWIVWINTGSASECFNLTNENRLQILLKVQNINPWFVF